jgi:2-phospho-L-lactate transferase/gluconeogenesis factor (CofD/UPF0052 family)
MTKHGETDNFQVHDFIKIIEKYAWSDTIDYVLINNWHIREEILEKYALEDKIPVLLDKHYHTPTKYRIIERDLVNESDYARHDQNKLSQVIHDFIDGWVK